jgi:hypothetical protein
MSTGAGTPRLLDLSAHRYADGYRYSVRYGHRHGDGPAD